MNETLTAGQKVGRFIETAGQKIPDPVIIFMVFYPLAFILTVVFLSLIHISEPTRPSKSSRMPSSA